MKKSELRQIIKEEIQNVLERKEWPERSAVELILKAKMMGLIDKREAETKDMKKAAHQIQNLIYKEWPTNKMFKVKDEIPYIQKMLKQVGIETKLVGDKLVRQ